MKFESVYIACDLSKPPTLGTSSLRLMHLAGEKRWKTEDGGHSSGEEDELLVFSQCGWRPSLLTDILNSEGEKSNVYKCVPGNVFLKM